jgi:5-methylcytosine-specific restriction endonuclease McrA
VSSARCNGSAYRRARAQVLAAAHATGGVCGICLGPLGTGPLEADHIRRRRDGGSDDVSNLRVVHAGCNLTRETTPELPRARRMRRMMR